MKAFLLALCTLLAFGGLTPQEREQVVRASVVLRDMVDKHKDDPEAMREIVALWNYVWSQPPGEPVDPNPEPPEPEPEPEPGEPVDSITSNGITWHFAGEVEAGQFVTDDWWIVGPVVVVAIDPPSTTAGGRVKNGSMIDPQVGWARRGGPGDGYPHGFDSSTGDGAWYSPELNVGLKLPLEIGVNRSLVSARSIDEPGSRPQLSDVAVLTVLAEPPPADSFRPPPYACSKAIRATADDVRWELIPTWNLPRPPPKVPIGRRNSPAMVSAGRAMARIWFHPAPDPAARPFHPLNHMPVYGCEIAATGGTAAMVLLDRELAGDEVREIAYGLIQAGIDMHGVTEAAGFREDHWLVGGGHASGVLGLIKLAGLLIGDQDMLSLRTERPGIMFNETGQTFYRTSDGVADWCSQYIRGTQPCPVAWDDSSKANDYRTCCTATGWWGWAGALEEYGLRGAVDHDAFFDYMKVYHQRQVVGKPNAPPLTHAIVEWSRNVWFLLQQQ